MSLPRPSDLPALSSRATLPEVTTPGYRGVCEDGLPVDAIVVRPPRRAHATATRTAPLALPDPAEDERLATWARVLP